MRKPTFCKCENKVADQLRGNREADQRLCFRYMDGTIPLLSKSEISSLYLSSVPVQPDLCRTRSETRTLVFSCRGSNTFAIYKPKTGNFKGSHSLVCFIIHGSIKVYWCDSTLTQL